MLCVAAWVWFCLATELVVSLVFGEPEEQYESRVSRVLFLSRIKDSGPPLKVLCSY